MKKENYNKDNRCQIKSSDFAIKCTYFKASIINWINKDRGPTHCFHYFNGECLCKEAKDDSSSM